MSPLHLLRPCWVAIALVLAGCDDESKPGRDGGPSAKPDAGAADSGEDAGRDAGADAGSDAGAREDAGPEIDPPLEPTAWRSLFDPTLSEWYRFLPSRGRDDDPDGVFKVEDGVLHVLGIAPPAGDQEFGYLATRSEYNNYRFRIEQKWGTKRFAPRADQKRDSGLLYHMQGGDAVWPQTSEFQIQEGDTGDLFLLGDVGATTSIDPVSGIFKEGGEVRVLRAGAVTKGGTFDSLTDWNELELIAAEREFVHIVNQQVNHRGWALEYKVADSWSALERGKIVLQAEGAEVFYRNAELRSISYPAPPFDAVVLFDGSNLEHWQQSSGEAPRWKIVDGVLEVEPGSGDLQTRESHGDVRLHLEFRLPATADANLPEAQRARSALSVEGRFVLALRDSFGRALSAQTSGAIGEAAPAVNEALPAETWQSLDVVFRAGNAARAGHITAMLNGSEIHRQRALPRGEASGLNLRLSEQGSRVRFRNIWLQQL
jgi:hypothetical protein